MPSQESDVDFLFVNITGEEKTLAWKCENGAGEQERCTDNVSACCCLRGVAERTGRLL